MRTLLAPSPVTAASVRVNNRNNVTEIHRYVSIFGVNSGARAPFTVQAFLAIRSNRHVIKKAAHSTQIGKTAAFPSNPEEKAGTDRLVTILSKAMIMVRAAVSRKT